jgi:hypothetical protein
MKSSDFRTCLRFRYLRATKHFAGLRCDTKHHGVPSPGYPLLDPYGLHVTSGCGKDGHRQALHNATVLELDRLCRFAGMATELEEHGAFRADLPENNNRPDITIRNTNGLQTSFEKIYIDVAITCPLEGSSKCVIIHPGVRKATMKGFRAKERYRTKITHYKNILDQAAEQNPEDNLGSRPGVQPFVFETTGFIHPESLKFLQKIADLASETQKIPQESMLKFFKKRLSFCLQRALASAINTRTRKLLGRTDFRPDRSFQDSAIVEEGIW